MKKVPEQKKPTALGPKSDYLAPVQEAERPFREWLASIHTNETLPRKRGMTSGKR